MKKFLFTLAALLMAGSMFADNYFYIEDDLEVTAEFLAQSGNKARRKTVNVWAHFDDMVSGWQANLYTTGGVTVANAVAAEGMTFHGMDAVGEPKDYNVALSFNKDTQRFIGASQEAGYYYPEGSDPDNDDPVTIGANKWLPGEYLMFTLTLQFPHVVDGLLDDGTPWEGASAYFETTAASGNDPRIDSGEYTRPTNDTWTTPEDKVCDITIEAPAQTFAPAPEFRVADGKVYAEVAGYTVTLQLKDGEEWKTVDNPYPLPAAGNVDQVFNFQAQTQPNTETDPSAWTSYTYTLPALPTLGGYFMWSALDGDGHFTVTYNAGDYTGDFTLVVKDADGNVMTPEVGDAGEYYQAAEGEHVYTVEVTAAGYQPKSEDHTYNYYIPTYAPVPTFNWNAETYTVEATCADHTVVLMANGTEVANPYTVAQTYVQQKIVFSAYTVKSTEDNNSATVYYQEVTIPAQDLTPSQPATFRMETFDTYVEIYAEGPNVVLYDENGQEVDPQPYRVNRPEYSEEAVALHFTVSATTKNDDTDEVHYAPTTTYYPVTVPVQAKPEPQVVLPGQLKFTAVDMEGTDGGYFTVEYVGDVENVTVEVVDMIPANRAGEYKLDGYGKWLVKARATAEGYLPLEGQQEFEWVRVDAPAATMSALNVNPDNVSALVAGSNVTLYADEDCTEPLENPYIVDRPAYDPNNDASYVETIYAKTTADGAEPTVTPIQFTVPEMLPAPAVDIVVTDVKQWLVKDENGHWVEGTETNGAVLVSGKTYIANIDVPAEFADNVYYTINGGVRIKWDGKPIELTGIGEVIVVAWVEVENDKSLNGSDTEYMIENNFTGVNEIANGKAVAGVRYFNLAGQEMQEANGVTIVVTTYTDGTTSAVKVMK